MDRLYSWTATRSGGAITVTHSCGKITVILTISVHDGKVIATGGDGRQYELVVMRAPEQA